MNRQADKPRTDDSHYGISELLQESLDLRADSVGTILNRLLKAARIHMGMDIAFISEFEGVRRTFRYVDKGLDMKPVQVGDSDPLDESYCKRVVDGRLPELIRNAQELDEAQKLSVTRDLGIGAHLSVPIRLSDDSVFGTFCCFSFRADNSLTERDISLIRTFAAIAGELVEKDVSNARDRQLRAERIEDLLQGDRFSMVWQPITDIRSGQIAGMEALARFPTEPHPSPPGWFEEAASVGLADALEMRAIEKALVVLDRLRPPSYIACNASAGALMAAGGITPFRDLPLERVVLEITEHDVIADYEALTQVLTPLRAKGLRVAVDDAGAGYASFRHILQLNPDIIKLDMSLTRDIDSDPGRRSLASALVRFAREIDSKIVAEGVETQAELMVLSDLDVDMAQGYYLHRPKPMDALEALFRH